MHTEAPTRREIWLAVFLLVSLLFLPGSHSDLELPASIHTGLYGNSSTRLNSSLISNDTGPQNFRDRIRWEMAQVPETKIVAHVPGRAVLF